MRVRHLIRHVRLIAIVALAPTFVLAMEPTFVPATMVDPSLRCSSCYLRAVGGFFPWFVTEVPAQLRNVSLLDRFDIANLAILFVICLIVVTLVWIALRALLHLTHSTV